ncbi:NEDD4-binding protein 3 [Heterocephalus glaber]|uniref:NEDD4-binding protein 3 n=1 Tax=Heterocephalus glaber TaxID=10181 RepID=A0A0P6JAE9_HETGA|nr:NEDD4-binding protein 3 [Heterocephalus glaber]XP_004836739.1 NEDD4-binding protein 3 [Heterocephalus glaber]XP_004836740.1 NEDD4-binding protein 3 [Heterocephalus glaber]XP_012920479.1 NEDD4-binding protein 3 [Heterocephalus glaber]XP_021097703.1 NEDD4-binding protein 3 [Heterocephalus glaber]XP_021097722.1 NEDD4-binding protein 3 [Heterocephalus glaber]XP_021097728.1 NEDD4-binding protein 3 [Heterocephalus glaber]
MATAPGPAGIAMGSVGSLLERQDFSPEELRAVLARSRGPRQPDGLLRKGLGQRELLSYLHLPKKDGKTTKRVPRSEATDYATLYYREHPRAGDFSKTSLPERGRFDKCRIRPSVFKPSGSTGKGFLSMQSLAAHKGQKLWRSNGSLHTLACHPPLSPGPRASEARAQLLHALSLDEGGPEPEPSLSDSSSGGSFGRSPGARPSPFSSSLGHIDRLGGSLDRAPRSPKEAGPLAVLSCLPEPPPPYELSCPTADEVVALLPETCEELKRDFGDQDDTNPFTQVLQERQWLWLAELKRLYVERLHEVAQKAERSQRNLQLQLFMAQQEQRRLRKELRIQQGLGPERPPGSLPEADPGARAEEEARWEVCQKTAEISLLKQQLREAQAELAQKLAEIFNLKTQLRGSQAQAQAQDAELARLREAVRSLQEQAPREEAPGSCETDDCKSRGLLGEAGGSESGDGAEQLRAELLQERLRGQEQALRFEHERRTWQEEKEQVLRYQREIQGGYVDMYRRNQALEQELRELREPLAPWSPRLESSKI